MKKLFCVLALVGLAAALGPAPRYLEELAIGGGLGEPSDGGAEIAKNGDLHTDGAIWAGGEITSSGGLLRAHAAGDAKLEIDAGSGGASLSLLDDNTPLWSLRNEPENGNRFALRQGLAETPLTVSASPGGAITLARPLLLSGTNSLSTGGNITTTGTLAQVDSSSDAEVRVDAGGTVARYAFYNNGNTHWRWEADFSAAEMRLARSGVDVPIRVPGAAGGAVSIARPLEITGTSNNVTARGDIFVEGGDLALGTSAGTRGVLSAWHGAGGAAPGCLRLSSPNGTLWYLFVEDDGTLKVHANLPAQNADGQIVGLQN